MTPIPSQPMRPAIRSDILALALACVATAALWFVPVASDLLYPVRLFVTFIHEGSHALVALLTGGSVAEVVIQPDASGFTETLGGLGPLIVSAGYIGATAYGAGLLRVVRNEKAAKAALAFSGIVVGVLTLVMVRPWVNIFGWIWGVVIAVGLIFAGRRLKPHAAQLVAMFLGVECCLNALIDLRTLIGLATQSDGPVSDAVLMSRMIPLPPVVWALTFAMMSLLILYRMVIMPFATPLRK